MTTSLPMLAATCALPALLALASCEREDRPFRAVAPSADAVESVRVSDLVPGMYPPPSSTQPMNPIATSRPVATSQGFVRNDLEDNAYSLAQGQSLYVAFNCKGCHAMGGGDIGPPLMDAKWRYGSEPQQVYSTIVQGRPGGMPAFGGKIPDYQVWQLVAYVRSMSGQVRKDAAPGRTDTMQVKQPEHSTTPQKPVLTGPEQSLEMPD